ncbi:hypothetical protein BU15DRAFT_49524 [Melanogaster broomeanus]|nr:hypothetical protein BU15DRAFT_49524 [Melanogaster broomeanus]
MTGKGKFEQAAAHKAPIITPGDLTPEALRAWEMGCRQYFLHRSVEAADQVAKVAWNLQDPRMRDWYLNDTETFDALTFKAFVDAVRSTWLPSDWAVTARQKMLASTQGNKHFNEWAIEVESQNALLRGTASHLNDAALKYHLEAHMHPDLALEYRSADISAEEALRPWIEKVRLLDEKRSRDVARQREAVEKAIKANHAPSADRRSAFASSSKPLGATLSSNRPFVRLPPLTTEERKLLQDNDGCFKCRLPFQRHTSRNCTNDFPDAKSYKTLTAN